MGTILAVLFFVVSPIELEKTVIDGFKLKEFTCPTCTTVILNKELLVRLDILRKVYGGPIIITSGYRNPSHNLKVGGTPGSAHLRGEAIDFALPKKPKMFIDLLRKIFPFVQVNYNRNYAHAEIN